MRITIDLPEDVHQAALLIARDRHQTLSRTVADLQRLAIAGAAREPTVEIDQDTGLPLVHVGRQVTREDVRSSNTEGP